MLHISLPSESKPPKTTYWPIFMLAFGIVAFSSVYHYRATGQLRENLLRMEGGGGKNAPHANQNAKKAAEEAYNKAKEAYDQLFKKPNKTPEEKTLLDKLKKQVEHWRKKKDWNGENHSQKGKGSN